MKKVYQTIVDKGHGNCMQAAIASLFDLSLEEVPNFIELGTKWFTIMQNFYKDKGYEFTCFNPKGYDEKMINEILEYDGGVNGYFYAVVPSLTFGDGTTHAVVVDKKLNIVHDPNPNQKALTLSPTDVISVDTVKSNWHISVEGKFIKRKY